MESDDFDDVQSLAPKVVYVTEFSDSDDSSVEEETEEEKEAQRWKDSKKRTEIPSEFWHIQKLIKYMKVRILYMKVRILYMEVKILWVS